MLKCKLVLHGWVPNDECEHKRLQSDCVGLGTFSIESTYLIDL